MTKKILKLEGAQKMSKEEQKSINGGVGSFYCTTTKQCQIQYDEPAVVCVNHRCVFL